MQYRKQKVWRLFFTSTPYSCKVFVFFLFDENGQSPKVEKNNLFWRQAQIFLQVPFSFGDLCVLYIANGRMLLGIHNDVVCRNGYFLMQYRKQKVRRLFFTQTPHSSKVFVFFLFDENVKSRKVIFKKRSYLNHSLPLLLLKFFSASPYFFCTWKQHCLLA